MLLSNLVFAKNEELRGRGILAGLFWKMYTERKDWELKYE